MKLRLREERLLLMLQDQGKRDQGLTTEGEVPEETIGDQGGEVIDNVPFSFS